MCDLILRGGRVLDGAGNPDVPADVAIAGGRIAAVGQPGSAEAGEIVDVAGLTVCPGFIDAHCHSDALPFSSDPLPAKILQGVTTTAASFVFRAAPGAVLGGMMVRSSLNKFRLSGAVEIPIKLHPNMPPGTVLFFSKTLPYPLSNVPNTVQIRTRSEYYQIEWPLRARRYEYGVYADEVLQNYAPFAFGAITNIGNG